MEIIYIYIYIMLILRYNRCVLFSDSDYVGKQIPLCAI